MKKIGKTIGVFFRSVVVYSIAVPILFTILSVLCGILLPFVSLSVFILLFSSEGRKYLGQHSTQVNKLTNWQCFCLFAIATIVSPTPVLFVLSLILHWHLASTIFCGIMASLLIIVVTMFSVIWSQPPDLDEESEKKIDLSISTETKVTQQKQVNKNINEYEFYPKGKGKGQQFTKII